MPLSVNANSRSDPLILFDFEVDPGPDPPKSTKMENSSQHFIKDEHGDQQNGRFVQNDFSGFSVPSGNQGFGSGGFNSGAFGGSIDPSELSMNQQNRMMFNNSSRQGFGNQSSDFPGGSAITDDELLDSLGGNNFGGDINYFPGSHMGNNFNNNAELDMIAASLQGHGIQSPTNISQVYSHTPDDAPIQSPFVRGFPNAAQLRHHIQTQQQFGATDSPSSYNASPIIMSSSNDVHASSFSEIMSAKNKRKTRPEVERAGSSKNAVPQTPTNPLVGSLSLKTTESGMQAQPIQNSHLGRHGHQKSLSGTWDNTPGSLSYIESPMSSPGPGSAGHRQISDILGGKHASLPTKVDGITPSQQSQEAKRRRRRESHNLVERRRRDNINERIQELSFLVPQHRLEDEKVRKHLQNHTPLSPGLHGVSPPRATSMLAGGLGRRASGVGAAALTIPLEEKDRVPNKGDILNGAVGWTKDMMWYLYQKIKQEKEMQQKLEALGHAFPITKTEDEKRMEAELIASIESNHNETFRYSRGHGSGLRVPGYTDLAGAPLGRDGQPDQSLPINNQQFWHNTGSADMASSLAFKEEDEFGMDVS